MNERLDWLKYYPSQVFLIYFLFYITIKTIFFDLTYIDQTTSHLLSFQCYLLEFLTLIIIQFFGKYFIFVGHRVIQNIRHFF